MKGLLFALPLVLLLSCTENHNKTGTTKDVSNPASIFKPANMQEQMIYNRAIEAVNWGMPTVNFELMYQAAHKANADYNQIVYWPKLLDWRNQTLTPNPDVIYLMPFFNTKEVGPMVLEIPPADSGTIVGSIMDCWQMAIEDVGSAGIDKGKGGKYLFLPPGYKEKLPAGYIPMQSDTYSGYALLRTVLKSTSDTDVAASIEYSKRVKLYPLSQAGKSPQTTFVDVSKEEYNSLIPYNLDFFKSLDRMVQAEVWVTRDRAMIDQLKTIGIEKGKTFNPEARTQEILNQAIADAKVWFENRYEAVFTKGFFEGSRWAFPASEEYADGIKTSYGNPNSYPVDDRGLVYTFAFFSAKHIGEGQFYLMTIKDKNGESFKGNKTYRLNVPPNVPVRQYWSVTVYNRATHAFIRDLDRYNRSSQSSDIQKNTDGSVDIYFGSKAPEGKDANWIPTDTKGEFELLFRFYGPEKALFDKTWKMNDAEEIK